MLLVTNFRSFPSQWKSSSGIAGSAVHATSVSQFIAHQNAPDAVFLVNCDPRLTQQLAASRVLTRKRRVPLISVDLVLRQPRSSTDRLFLPIKRFLFSYVDHFIHYFRDLSAYERWYGIGPDRSSFVPFKVNLSARQVSPSHSDGQYIVCFGRSMRDFDTFIEAMERLPYPGAIPEPNFESLKRHGSRFTRPLKSLPGNITLLKDDGSEAAQVRILTAAKAVVIPILKTSIAASGISTTLNAMMLGKCVIGSEGPGMTDVFTDGEILTAPPEDARALAETIKKVMHDDTLRRRIAAAGRRYATRVGGERQLYERIIDQVVTYVTKQ